MSTLSKYNTLVSIEMGDSESINKTPEQRNQAINFAVEQIFDYRNWKDIYKNSTIQTVNGIAAKPFDMKKPAVIWYGKNSDFFYGDQWINQTDALSKFPLTTTVTDLNGVQVISMEDDQNRGHVVSNLVSDSTIGINNVVANTQVGQTFVMNGINIEGLLVKLSKVGLPIGTLTLDVYATAAGLPTGASLGSSTVDIRQVGTTEQYIWFKLLNSLAVTDSDTLAITITPSYATSATDFVAWSYSTTSQITGNQVLFNGGWSAGTGDNAFVVCNDYYNLQYVKGYLEMTEPSDESGLNSSFNQAVAKYAAGILYETKSQYDKAGLKFHGGRGEDSPTKNSAFGLLNRIWSTTMEEATRTNRGLKTVFQGRTTRYPRYYEINRNY